MRAPFRVFLAAAFLSSPFALAPAGCASHGPDLVARMASAKTIYESVGYKAHGSPAMGTVAEGSESKVPLKLESGCYQIVAFAGDGLKGIDVALTDPAGKNVGTAMKQEGQSSVKHCVAEQGTYNLVVKSTGGSGAFLAQPYVSGEKAAPKVEGGDTGEVAGCIGDDCGDDPGGNMGMGGDPCSNPPELSIGSPAKGTTAGRGYGQHASCSSVEGPSVVYRVHVEGRHKLVVDLNAKFDAVVALYRAAASDGYLCDGSSEIDCSDDYEGVTTKGHVEAVVDTGDYGILVSGYDGIAGEYEIKTRLDDAPSLESICATARPVTPGTKASDLVSPDGSNFHASCAYGDGAEALFKVDLKGRSRVRVGMRASGGGESSLSLRRRCEDSSSEVACSKDWHFDGVSWTGLLDGGAYTVIADSADATHTATIDLDVATAPEAGAGTADGDTCKDAKPLPVGTSFTIDTFQATGDMKASCASDAAADVVYKLDVKAKSRLYVSATEDEGHHVVAVQKTCGDTKGELGCDTVTGSKGFDATVDPGSYYVVVKGKGIDDFGRARMTAKLRELAPAAAACKSATKLVPGKSVTDSTSASPDRFASEKCGGSLWQQASGDKVYQFTLKQRSKVNVQLKSGSFYNAILSLRSDCSDPTRNEIICSNPYSKVIDRDLDAGTYYLVVDGYGTKAEGTFTIEMNATPIK